MQQLYLPLKYGRQLITRITDPAAAANFTYAPSDLLVERLFSIRMQLATDANAATRTVFFDIQDPTGVIQTIGTNQTQGANETFVYMAFENIGIFEQSSGTPAFSFMFLPQDIILPRTGSLTSRVPEVQAGDQISGIVIVTYVWAKP